MTLFVADINENKMMEMFDLKPDYKWFVRSMDIEVTKSYSKEEIMHLINSSSDRLDGIFIPAIKYDGKMYLKEDVSVLSDGETEYYFGKFKNDYD